MSKREQLEKAGQQSLMDLTGYRLEFNGIGSMANSMLPQTDWRMPTEFPDLRREKFIALDIESYDPDLQRLGPGFVRGRDRGYVVGVAVATPSFCEYYPIAHKEGPNIPRNIILPWLAEQFSTDIPKIGANLLYDLEGLHFEGVKVQGPILDVQNAEALLDEEAALFDYDLFCADNPEGDTVKAYHALRGFSLDALAWKHLRRRKNEVILKQIQQILGIKDIKGNLYKLPARVVAPYAKEDAALALSILEKQLIQIDRENLGKVWKLESDLVPLLLAMRLKGVRVDLDAAEQLNKKLKIEQANKLDELRVLAGSAVNPWANDDLAKLCDKLNVKYLLTERGNPSFTAEWLRGQEHPALLKVLDVRKIEKMRRDFVEGVVLEMNVRGRLHPQFHQLRRDDDGTRSGRLSSSNPNLQQIPARDEYFGPLIRSLFIPESGCDWLCADYSAQEPRLTVHYAFLCKFKGAAEAVHKYKTDPKTDYHQLVADMANILRKHAKQINLGLAYGMGKRKLAWKLGYMTEAESLRRDAVVPPEVDDILAKYHESVPFVKGLMERASHTASTRGFITTLLGRRRHFDLYEPNRGRNTDWDNSSWGTSAMPLSLARHTYGGDVPLVRAFTHKALNALIQGSAADMIKQAMLMLWRLGYVPHLTIHDELDDSVNSEKQANEIKQVMVEAVELVLPVRVDMKTAPNWGAAK
ncbi:MAG: hypothetical protein E6Q97_26610 [Desulfurellales bacterium]|nr:MAG: hypothetical protein E6Q97_26610 [Desulfurellales bacterium]